MRSQTVATKLQRLAEQAKRHPEWVFTTLAHMMDVEFLKEAYRLTRKDGAKGIDGQTAADYAKDLDANLAALHERLKTQTYRAPPVRRVYLEKDDGTKRPIGVPTFEDKVVQRAVAMLLGAIYEEDFKDSSYGFRPQRSAHQAVTRVREEIRSGGIGWIIDADVRGFFDNLPHGALRAVIQQRVNDGSIMRLIGRWLKAGVIDGSELSYPEKGTPQGGVVSPMIANIFLHHVLDEWFATEVKPRLNGCGFLVRYGDDFIIGCQTKEDAERVMGVLPKRFLRFGLEIHPEKTAMIAFSKPSIAATQDTAHGKGTFDFLGLTHYWARSRNGFWVIKRKTAASRMRRTARRLWRWCQTHRHDSVADQYAALSVKLKGHYAYFGIRCNMRALQQVRKLARYAWRYWLNRRSSKRSVDWETFGRMERQGYGLPLPRIVHNI